MSKASFDDSSNLVDIEPAANGEQKETESRQTDNQLDLLSFDEPEEAPEGSKKSKSKKSKAKRLFKRAKSPISGAINKTTKEFKKLSSLPKHHYTPPKSPQRSPSREKLTEEYSQLEKKLGEKKSEEWKAFLQMQDRVKETVAKTQASLTKYSSQSEDEEVKPKQTKYSTKWTGFNDDSGFEPEVIDTSLKPSISVTGADLDNLDFSGTGVDQEYISTDDRLSATPSPVCSEQISLSSMENIPSEEIERPQDSGPEASDEFDFLGLGQSTIAAHETATQKSSSSDVLADDLLGLDSFLSSAPAPTQVGIDDNIKTNDILGGYTFTSSISSESTSTVTESKKIDSDILMFEQPMDTFSETLKSSSKPVEVKADSADRLSGDESLKAEQYKTDNLRTEKTPDSMLEMFDEPLKPAAPKVSKDQVVPDILESSVEIKPQRTGSSLPDDFASFDPMRSDFSSSDMRTVASASPVTVGRSPSPQAGPVYGSVPTASMDIFSKIRSLSSGGSQSVSPARKAAPKPKDHFEFVKKELKKPSDNENDENEHGYKPLVALTKGKKASTDELVQKQDESEPMQDKMDVSKNPFLSSNFTEEMQPDVGFDSSKAAALFGLESDVMNIDSGFEEKPETTENAGKIGQSWVDATKFDTTDFEADLETEEIWEETGAEKKKTGDIWGAEMGCNKEHVDKKLEEGADAFHDDFSKLDGVPVDQTFEESSTTVANPFLVGGMTDQTLVATSTANPFLDTGDFTGTSDFLGTSSSAVLSDSESFFQDSVAEPTVEGDEDLFDPFKVSSKPSFAKSDITSKTEATVDPLDVFSTVAASGDAQLAKPSADDDQTFMLDIKPASEKPNIESLPVAPALAPPPKPPKSPQPPRENPFDRDSPPEENFAQFEVMDTGNNEKQIEPPQKSLSTESTSTEEEVEENLEPLSPFLPECEKDTFKLMLRYPTKKKIAGNRYWKNVVVKLEKQKEGLTLRVLNDARDQLPIQELPLQPCYSLSDLALQQYDQYGKIHTVKIQYVFYKERVGIKTERITPSIVRLKKRTEKPKATMILDHSPQVSELLKFGCLDKAEITLFIQKVEDEFMKMDFKREKTLTYTKDEITAEVRDEYYAELDQTGKVISQKARCRVFVLAFLSGMPIVEIGMNDRRKKGKEVVGRADIIPIKTEEWIKLENVEFHCSVDKDEFEKKNSIKFQPLDACQFELMRYRVRLRENKELPLQLTIQQILKQRKCEIRCDLLVTGYHSYSKKHGQFPCEDIEVQFPIPEVWIYMFRYERRFGYGSVHSAARKPGKIKGLERLTMMAQGAMNQALMEADVGTAKYEHIYRSIVWRIPRLPIRNQGAYTSHLFRLKLELGPHDEIPESFETHSNVSFTMPCSTVSQSQIRSIAVTNPNPPEKWVRSSAKYEYRIEIEHLDEYPELLAIGTVYQEAARPSVSETKDVKETNGEEDNEDEEEERDPRLAQSDSDSSDSD